MDDLNKLTTLLKYMLDHNREHAAELSTLAHNLHHADQRESADVINDAVKEFAKGTEKLVKALELIKDGN
jgi:galactokinase/mevalonate kinase-like predicted kinase